MKDKGKPKPRQKPRYGDPVDDTSFHNTTFGIRAPVRRRSPPRHGRNVKVKGSKRHVARRELARKVKKIFPGMYRDDVAKNSVIAKRARRAAAPMQEIPEEEDDDDDTEVAVLPPDDHDTWGSHGGDEPGSGSPPGITA